MELNQREDQSQPLMSDGSSNSDLNKKQSRSWFGRRKKKHSRPKRLDYPEVHVSDRQRNSAADFPTNKVSSTKYSFATFIPKVLMLEFSKVTTLYYTLVCIVNLIPAVAPLSPFTSIFGLLVVLFISFFREGYEDYQRYIQDSLENSLWYDCVFCSGDHVPTRSESIAVGDLLYLTNGQKIPADLVLLSSSLPHGNVYLETSQLDGETSLKLRSCIEPTAGMQPAAVAGLGGRLDCEVPHHNLFDFRGTLHYQIGGDVGSLLLTSNCFAPRGAYVRNTEWVVGLAAYVGVDTKSQMNQQIPDYKKSRLEHRLTSAVVIVFCVKVAICFFLATLGTLWDNNVGDDNPYLDTFGGWGWLIIFLGYFVLLSYFIPLPLVISVQIIRLVQARFIEWDAELMVDEEEGAVARASNLTDELGAIKFLFCDKTGTLTENEMVFSKCAVGGRVYQHALEGQLRRDMERPNADSNLLNHFLLNMSLNHTVMVTTNSQTQEHTYHASSPDESCLCQAASTNGYQFLERSGNECNLEIFGTHRNFQLLHTIEFSSERKRMSVIVRNPEGEIYLYCKGADIAVFPLLASEQRSAVVQVEADVEAFSQEGLRTLVLAYRRLSEEEWRTFSDQYVAAQQSGLPNWRDNLDQLWSTVESNLTVNGTTGVEDRLQTEVPQSLHFLRQAGIKVWVVTGDKAQTAVNVGYLANLITPQMTIFYLKDAEKGGETLRETLEGALRHMEFHKDQQHACVVDSKALNFVLKEMRAEFLHLALGCVSVICTRATPIQKAKIVEVVMQETESVCMAIGDGANDVSMIREANVGVGVYGKEGTSAVRSADFAIRRFRHLCRLVAVHGRYCAIRNAGVIHYYFYDNATVFISQIWFAFTCGFSTQSLYNDLLMLIFNLVITALPPFAYGVFERDIDPESIREFPRLYGRTQRSEVWNRQTMLKWWTSAIYHSMIIFFVGYSVYRDGSFDDDGQTSGLTTFGNMVMTCGIFVVIFQLALIIQYWTLLVHALVWGAIAFYLAIFAIQSQLGSLFPEQYNEFERLFSTPAFYAYLFLCFALCLGPELAYHYYQQMYFPRDYQIIKERKRIKDQERKTPLGDFSEFGDFEGGIPMSTYPQSGEEEMSFAAQHNRFSSAVSMETQKGEYFKLEDH